MSLWPVIRDLFIRKAAEEVIEVVMGGGCGNYAGGSF